MSRPKGLKNKTPGISRIEGYYAQLNTLISPEVKAEFKLLLAVNNWTQQRIIEDYISYLILGGVPLTSADARHRKVV